MSLFPFPLSDWTEVMDKAEATQPEDKPQIPVDETTQSEEPDQMDESKQAEDIKSSLDEPNQGKLQIAAGDETTQKSNQIAAGDETTQNTEANTEQPVKEEPMDDDSFDGAPMYEEEPTNTTTTSKGKCGCQVHARPLLEYLCSKYRCTLKELHVLFNSLETRCDVIDHLRHKVQLQTNHIKPPGRNFTVPCNDVTAQSATLVPALNGYLGATVRLYYMLKHNIKLRHPYLPCVIHYGGGQHRSYYPLEVLSVVPKN